MRRDWDFVTFDDYKRDTDEIVQLSTAAIATLKRERDDLKRLVFALVKAAGGSLSVPDGDLDRWHESDGELITEVCEYDRTRRFRIEKKPASG